MARRLVELDQNTIGELRWDLTEYASVMAILSLTCHSAWATFTDAGRRLAGAGANDLTLWNTFFHFLFA
jgi:hypothetical protein